MPGGRNDSEDGARTSLSLPQRLLLALPRLGRGGDRKSLTDRLRGAVLKPEAPAAAAARKAKTSPKPSSVEDLETSAKYADDKERLIGLLAAPFAGAIGLLVSGELISQARPAILTNGQVNKLHSSLSLFNDLELVVLGLAVLMLVTAWFRKRLYLGIVMALYGLAIFNLHYWGFGVPFVMVGAWLLVRSYRFQRDLRAATDDSAPTGRVFPTQSNKRYTPRSSPAKRSSAQKRVRRAG